MNPNKKCVYCGEEFKPSKLDSRIKYCSAYCRIEDRKKNKYNTNWARNNHEHVRDYRNQTQEKRLARRREQYANDENIRNYCKKQAREWGLNNPRKRKAQRLNTYNITIEQYDEMLDSQKHKCVICGHSDKTDKNFFPVIDHNHENGRVRGLLCMNCNMGLGKFKDDVNLLRSAIAYLEMN